MKSIRFPLHDIQEVFRGRYRCPRCKSVGTWNPHGGLVDARRDLRHVRRWMCKWCGLYRGPEGWNEVVADLTVDMSVYGPQFEGKRGVWQLVKDAAPGSTTPQKCLAEHMGQTWPWWY